MWIFSLQILSAVVLTIPCSCAAESVEYVLEGKDVTLKCRIPRPLTRGARLYWMGPVNGTMDNYAIDNVTFNKDYRVDLDRAEGRYDLTITRATYHRNNGLFICRVKEEGTGFDLHSASLNLTVLIKPGSPRISPQHPSVTQGKPIRLTCSSRGGSPDPEIFWYRRIDGETLPSVLKPGGGRDFPTTSVLTLEPTREDDGVEFMCEVRNRALSPQEKMVSSVRLNVDYYPIVQITPSNPVRAIEGDDVTLTCDVDAKPPVQNVRWLRGGAYIHTTETLSLRRVSLDDAGRYICQADNSLGRPGEAEVTVNVLYPPVVNVIRRRDVSDGDNVDISCNVTSNPSPDLVYWTKIGDSKFRQNTEFLRLRDVSSADHGEYVCHAVNVLSPTRGPRVTLEGNGTVAIRVRHAPGKSFILPSQPVAVQGKSTVLTCGADPPGYPETKYRWWREKKIVMEIGENYTIPVTTRENEGTYYCQPFNMIGNASVISANLRVFQAPRITEGLKPTAVYERERTDLRLSCRAQGKPKPVAKWYKDDVEIKESQGFFTIQVNYTEMSPEMGYIVLSTLAFRGPERIGQKVLRPEDRGRYECSFENEAEKVGSSQLLRIQHPPSLAHKRSKVAYDVGDDAELMCRMRAFPSPTFEWMHDNNILQGGHGGRYSVNDTDVGDDVYVSVLGIRGVSQSDYGPYTCKAINDEGPSKTLIFLQRRGLPSPPENGVVTDAGVDFLEVTFDPAFDGGYPHSTNYSARVSTQAHGEEKVVGCGPYTKCLIHDLRQNTEYRIMLFAVNPRGQSTLSSSLIARTTLDPTAIPPPVQVFAETDSGAVVFSVPEEVLQTAALTLEGRVEVKYEPGMDWTKVPAQVDTPEGRGKYVMGPINGKTIIRVRLCAKDSLSLCGPYQNAQQVLELPQIAAADASNTVIVIAIIVTCVVVAVVVLALVCCNCRKRQKNSKIKKKAADMEVSHRGVVTQQAPPPPYYTVGLENKGMDGSIDRLNDHSKALMYNSQQAYQNYPPQNDPNANGLGGGYLDNSYSNSNNGGSVNSQDSLWQVKSQQQQQQQQMQQQHLQQGDLGQMSPHQQMDPSVDPRNAYQYNPMVHGGYGISGYDDYAHYPPKHESEYSRSNMGDPYGVHKQRGMDVVDDSYEVNGMPNPYLDFHHNPNHQGVQMHPPQDAKPQISFDESLESGFSTPNNRNRRIIREIIV